MSADIKVISEVLKSFKSFSQKKDLLELSPHQSWVVHPEFIQDESLKAIILFSL
ncbi:hypothetical protein HGB47_03600 [Leptospira yasudae]|uniref:hypothetical protein n=1 Tax=Leptospira yasudae TaxID=2202201 RepID=UPI001C4F5F65|nr:hypothetical protein [Leptospira yasudae]MBW0432692.1 hypothetical protein [Leptospira yasudae]